MTDIKNTLRKKLLQERDGISDSYRKAHAAILHEKLLPFCLSLPSEVVHTFIPFKNEPDLHPLLDALLLHQLKIIAPKTYKHGVMEQYAYTGADCLQKGLYQTLYPATDELYEGEYSVILVPGLAFDKYGRRLGYGGGYYDRFLQQHANAIKIGVVYPFQFLEEVPVEPHDMAVDWIFTTDLQKPLKV